jgi:hypothetical protein
MSKRNARIASAECRGLGELIMIDVAEKAIRKAGDIDEDWNSVVCD